MPIEGDGISLGRGGRRVLDDVSIRFVDRGISVLLGPNGAGKSLLLRVLAALVQPGTGRVSWAGQRPHRALRAALGFVFQRPVLLRRSALENVCYALRAAGFSRSDGVERARSVLAETGLDHLAQSPARLLSGGEQQRLALARALATEPEVLFLDEPTANLDPASTAQIEMLAIRAAEAGRKVVLVTHDVAQARRLATEITFLHQGRVLEQSPAGSFFRSPSSEAAGAFIDGRIVI